MMPLVCGRFFCLQPVKVGTEYHICLQPQNALKFTKTGQKSPEGETNQKDESLFFFFAISSCGLLAQLLICWRRFFLDCIIAKKGNPVSTQYDYQYP